MKAVDFPSILEQLKSQNSSRRKLDTILLQILGYSDKEISELLSYLYPALANEIVKLKTLMEG